MIPGTLISGAQRSGRLSARSSLSSLAILTPLSVAISDATTQCYVQLVADTSPDNGSTWTSTTLSQQLLGPTQASNAYQPFSISGAVLSLPDNQTTFHLQVMRTGSGTGSCAAQTGAQMYLKTELANP
mgnify:CR=1 FL=1